MSALTALSTMICDPAMGGGSVIQLTALSELLKHLDSGSCTEKQVEAMAAEHRGPNRVEWAAMRGGDSEQEDTPPEPTPAPEPETVTEDPVADESVEDVSEPEANEDPGSV